MMALVLVVGALAGWHARQARARRVALATIRAAHGTVIFVDQRPDSASWWARLYRWTGDDWFREVELVALRLTWRPDPAATEAACAAIARLGRVGQVTLGYEVITASALGSLAAARVDELQLVLPPAFDAAIPAQVGRLRHLRALWIRGPSAAFLPVVAGLAQLEELHLLRLPRPATADLAPLRSLRGLKELTIDLAPLDEACLDPLDGLGPLTSLELGGTRLTDAGLRRLAARAPRLTSLVADGSLLTDRGIEALAGLAGLETLRLSGRAAPTARLTDASLATLGRLPALKHLVLPRGRFTDAGLDALRHLGRLDALDLGSAEASQAGWVRLLAGRTFARLGLHGPGVTDAVLPHLAGHLTGHSLLNLAGSPISDAGIPHLAALKLGVLVLDGTALTDRGLATLATGPTLRALDAQGTAITPAGAAAFQAARPLTTLATGPIPAGGD